MSDLDSIVDRLDGDWPPSAETLASIGAELAPESTHGVLRVHVDGEPCALKVFQRWDRAEPEREWALLELLDGTDLAPRPVWRSAEGARPVVVSTWIEGTTMRGRPVEDHEVDLIAAAHTRMHATPPTPSLPAAISCGARVVARTLAWWNRLGAIAAELELSAEVRRRVEGEPFATSPSVTRLLADAPKVVTRGDTNLQNYVIGGQQIRLIDFEDAGLAEVAVELADMIEHFANRGRGMERLAAHFSVDADALHTAQGLVAEFWFVILLRRASEGLGMMPPTTADEQLARLVELGAIPQ